LDYPFATLQRSCYIRGNKQANNNIKVLSALSLHSTPIKVKKSHMKNQKILLGLIAVVSLNGCSALKARFIGTPTTPITSTKPLEYNFSQPRRMALDPSTLAKLNNVNIDGGRFRYYSANGDECRTISSDLSRTACKVSGAWKESAPILVVRLP
jgi:hypothetical protein